MHIEHVTNKTLKNLAFQSPVYSLHMVTQDLEPYIPLMQATPEYALLIWHPHTAHLTNCTESIRGKAARLILRFHSPYRCVAALKQSLIFRI